MLIHRVTAALIAATLTIGLATPAVSSNADSATIKYTAVWQIENRPPLDTTTTVQPGQYAVKSRILPYDLIELTSDLVSSGGDSKILLPAGTQLFGLSKGGPRSLAYDPLKGFYCSFEAATGKTLLGTPSNWATRFCAVDDDNDGRFDSTFTSACEWELHLNGKVKPKALIPTKAGSYRVLDPRDVRDPIYIGAKYNGVAVIPPNRANFSFVVGNSGGYPLASGDGVNITQLPQSVQFSSLRFTVLSANGSSIVVKEDAPVAPRAFKLVGMQTC